MLLPIGHLAFTAAIPNLAPNGFTPRADRHFTIFLLVFDLETALTVKLHLFAAFNFVLLKLLACSLSHHFIEHFRVILECGFGFRVFGGEDSNLRRYTFV